MAAADVDPYQIAKELFPNQPEGFPYDVEDFEDIVMPEDDDMGIPSDDDEVEEEELETDSGFANTIVVGNLPVVAPEKYDKLLAVVRKIYSQIGAIREGGLWMPVDPETNQSRGFAFIEFATPLEAQLAKEQTQGYKLDKNHTFVVNMFDDFDKYEKVPDEYTPPETKEYQAQENLYEWLTDRYGRDQILCRYGDWTAVYWNDGKRCRADEVYKREFWTESYVQWTPMGHMLVTVHKQGIAVWGGPGFVRLSRLSHPNVRAFEFSPHENYVITFSAREPANPRESTEVTYNVWDVRSGRKMRVFQGPVDEYNMGGGLPKWPLFRWSGGTSDQYFARLGKNTISVYTTPDMMLLDKRSLKLDAVQDFEWSPSEPVLAVYTAEQGNLPARISLIKIPERTEIRQKNLFGVSDIRIIWHPQGDYLAVKVDRFTKTKKSTYTGFEVFSLRERDIPMEVLELPNKSEKVLGLTWEPKGHRFAIVHGDGPRPSVSFYSMKDDKGRASIKLLGTLVNKACNEIFWSPQGHNVVLAGLRNLNGQLEFFNVDEFETMATAEHFMATDVTWDPTGRYVASCISNASQMENAFIIWSFMGKQLYSLNKDRFLQFAWRPRMPSVLPKEKEEEIVRNLKTYSKRYEEEDEALLNAADIEVLQERQRLLDEFNAWLATKTAAIKAKEEFGRRILGAAYDELPYSMESQVVEQTLETKEEPYNPAA